MALSQEAAARGHLPSIKYFSPLSAFPPNAGEANKEAITKTTQNIHYFIKKTIPLLNQCRLLN